MTKVRLQISVWFFLLWTSVLAAQQPYQLRVRGVDRDPAFLHNELGIPAEFPSRMACTDFVSRLPASLQNRGYVTASIDSIRFDSTSAYMVLFTGQVYKWAALHPAGIPPEILENVGWNNRQFDGKPIDFAQVSVLQERILDYLENNGRPFGKVYLDSLQLQGETVQALLKVNQGPLYKIDSIRVYGNAKIANSYLQHYLDIPNGTLYNKEKLRQVSAKINQLQYIEEERPSNLTLLGTGSVLNMYLRQKKSSQVNVLIGFLPNNDQLSSKKLLVTGEANINLKNALGAGETIGLNWQQLQVRSPRLDIAFQYPYLFKSPVGLDFAFDIFRKDSIFVNINLQVGGTFALADHQAGKLFLQRFQTIVNGINTSQILQTRRLDDQADLAATNLGIDYELNNTNYRLNPRTGNELRIITSAGTKKIRKNSAVLELKDPSDPSFDFESLYDTIKLKTYQFRAQVSGAHYLPLGRQSTLKMAFNGGFFQSGNIFRNELFQLGGYRLLRGFDEESQYLSQYAIGTVEYHLLYLMGQNSYFYVLADGGWGRNNSQNINVQYTYLGTGLGIAFETKAGVFNLAWAVGKRNDTDFNLRQSKLHFGFVNYF